MNRAQVICHGDTFTRATGSKPSRWWIFDHERKAGEILIVLKSFNDRHGEPDMVTIPIEVFLAEYRLERPNDHPMATVVAKRGGY